MVLMHKTCIFTKPVFTDVNTRYARGYTGGEQGGCNGGGEGGAGEVPRGGPHRIAPRRAAQRHLFILPRRMDRELVCGARMYARTSARGVYLTGARTCNAESADPPRRNGRRRRPTPPPAKCGGPARRYRSPIFPGPETRPAERARLPALDPRNYGMANAPRLIRPVVRERKRKRLQPGKAARYYWEMDTLSMIA